MTDNFRTARMKDGIRYDSRGEPVTGFPDPNDPAYMDTPDVGEHPIEDTTPERLAQRDRLAEKVSDSLAATTEGTEWAEAPEPSDEPGSHYVLRLTNELASRGVRIGPDEGLREWYRTVIDSASQSVDQQVAGRVEVDYSALVRLDPDFPALLAALEGSA